MPNQSAATLKNDHRRDDTFPEECNFILFFSFPFYPCMKLYKKTWSLHGHLSLCLGRTLYQLHDPAKLRSRFLVSRMPLETWLYDDGCWHDWNEKSPTYRHVHLYETGEVKRTSLFYAALNAFPQTKIRYYQNYFDSIERGFQRGTFCFDLYRNNCAHAILRILYNEGWLNRDLFDTLPAVTLKRLVRSWKKTGISHTTGVIRDRRLPQFRLHRICLGIPALDPEQALIRQMQG